ncbi:hypothetical protein [Algoriphagus formosus]|uniref:hypothetical protein n=1 Tax=Algoriphagus formosus TaxID=2007308 RepID=UPI0018E232B4|nr:hypothetical protein [Algoriphagus formosus]
MFILASGPVTYFLLEEEFLQGELRAKIPFITGMALPMIIKKIIPNPDTELGATDEKMSFREVLNSYLS